MSDMRTEEQSVDGCQLIAQERKRQIEVEEWTTEHDDSHDEGELAKAAACYALPPGRRDCIVSGSIGDCLDLLWPWDDEWWKPTPDDRIRELVKAGALIAAEIDRLQRTGKPSTLDEPFKAGDWVVCVQTVGALDCSIDEGHIYQVRNASGEWVSIEGQDAVYLKSRFRRATAAEIAAHRGLEAVADFEHEQVLTATERKIVEEAKQNYPTMPVREVPPRVSEPVAIKTGGEFYIESAPCPDSKVDLGLPKLEVTRISEDVFDIREVQQSESQSFEQMYDRLRAAGASAWDDVADPIAAVAEMRGDYDDLPHRVLAMCKARNWSLHWTARGAYLHLEASELIEALRGKRGDPTSEAADVLLVLMSITESNGINWASVIRKCDETVERLENAAPYPGEERGGVKA